MNEDIKKFDENNNLIYCRYCDFYEYWREYDKNNNLIYEKHSTGIEKWWKYNENNKYSRHYKESNGPEYWYKYSDLGRRIEITEKEFNEIEFRIKEKEYNSRTKCSRFELMDI